MKHLIIISIFILLNITAFGEIRTITLSNAVELAFNNNPQIKQMEAELKIAEAQFGQSFADFWIPDVTLSATYNLLDEATVTNSYIQSFQVASNITLPPPISASMPVLSPRTITNAYMDNYSLNLGITKPLFSGFRLWDSMELKKQNLDMVNFRLTDKKKELEASVTTSFYNLFLLKENVSMNESLNQHSKNRLDDTIAKYKGGILSEYDKIRSEVQFENSIPSLDKMRNSYTNIKLSLCMTIGVNDLEAVEFIGELFDGTNGITDFRRDEAVLLALSNNISLKAMDKTLETAKLARKISDSAKYPTLFGYFNDSLSYKKANMMNDNERSWVNGWNLGLQLSIPVDDWLPISKTVQMAKEADANVLKAGWNRKQLEDNIILQVKILINQMNEAKRIMERQAGTYQKAKKAYELCGDRFDQGNSTSVELTDAEMVYVQSRSIYLQAVYDYCSAWINLKRLI